MVDSYLSPIISVVSGLISQLENIDAQYYLRGTHKYYDFTVINLFSIWGNYKTFGKNFIHNNHCIKENSKLCTW